MLNNLFGTWTVDWVAVISFFVMIIFALLSLYWYLNSSRKLKLRKAQIIKKFNLRDGLVGNHADYKKRFSAERKKSVSLEADKEMNFFAKGQPSFAIICGILSIIIAVSSLTTL